MKALLMFPGQGSQYVGMTKNLNTDYFLKANEVLGYDLLNICQNGPEEQLKSTENTQPALLAHSISSLEIVKNILQSKNIEIYGVLGHSVGEYSALVAANSISFEDAIRTVRFRGESMQKAVPHGLGTMYAILKAPLEKIIEGCTKISEEGHIVSPANFNDPSQVVVSGHTKACEELVTWLEQNVEGRFRAIPLPVSAPFHCELMKEAELSMAEFLNTISIKKNQYPYIANIDANLYPAESSEEKIKENLIKQICGSVQFIKSIEKIPEDVLCIEVGPGKVLCNLVRKINRNLKTINTDQENFQEEFLKLENL